jgi:hypothetical protein
MYDWIRLPNLGMVVHETSMGNLALFYHGGSSEETWRMEKKTRLYFSLLCSLVVGTTTVREIVTHSGTCTPICSRCIIVVAVS